MKKGIDSKSNADSIVSIALQIFTDESYILWWCFFGLDESLMIKEYFIC